MGSAVDVEWFKQIQQVCAATEEVEWLQKNMQIIEEEREQFLANEIENPLFTYKPPTQAAALVAQVEALATTIATTETNPVVADLYKHKIANQITRIGLAVASGAGNDKDFYTLSCVLYGKPRKKYFAYIAKQVVEQYKQVNQAGGSVGKPLYKILSKIDTTKVDISAGILPPPVAEVELVESVAQAVAIFEHALHKLEITGWQVVVEEQSNRSRFSVSAHSKRVFVPNQTQLDRRGKKMTTVQLEGIVEHEIGVHANRANAGGNSQLQLLGIGLDSYLRGEEGLASYVQQQVEGAQEFYGFDRYLAASLAVGMDGSKRDFRGVFELMVAYYQLQFASTGQKPSYNRIQNAAWEVCLRVFRGTTGQTPGCVYTKDIVYLEGNIGIWHFLSDKPHTFPDFFVGKYNPLLPRHVKALQTLGIITQDW